MKSKIVISLLVTLVTVTSCLDKNSLNEDVLEPIKETPKSLEILSFKNKLEFAKILNSNSPVPKLVKDFNTAVYEGAHFKCNSFRAGKKITSAISIEELVPDKRLASFLNEKGEIIVGGLLYRITQNGTFYTEEKNRKELEYYSDNFEVARKDETQLEENLYQYKSVKRIDTYKNVDFTYKKETSDNFRGSLADINLNNLIWKDAHPEHWYSKLWGKMGGRVSNTMQLNSERRLNAEVFNYDNGFIKSIGVTAKKQKKMWYGGWAMMENIGYDELRIGFKNAFLKSNIEILPEEAISRFTLNGKREDDDLKMYQTAGDIVYGENVKWNVPEINDSSKPRAELLHFRLDEEGMADGVAYPFILIAGEKKVYDFHPGFWAKNQTNNSELTFRFVNIVSTIMFRMSFDPYTLTPNLAWGSGGPINKKEPKFTEDLKNFLHISFLNNDKANRELIKGRFYAVIHWEGEWKGMVMEWYYKK